MITKDAQKYLGRAIKSGLLRSHVAEEVQIDPSRLTKLINGTAGFSGAELDRVCKWLGCKLTGPERAEAWKTRPGRKAKT